MQPWQNWTAMFKCPSFFSSQFCGSASHSRRIKLCLSPRQPSALQRLKEDRALWSWEFWNYTCLHLWRLTAQTPTSLPTSLLKSFQSASPLSPMHRRLAILEGRQKYSMLYSLIAKFFFLEDSLVFGLSAKKFYALSVLVFNHFTYSSAASQGLLNAFWSPGFREQRFKETKVKICGL